jgi:RecB family exonuclease
VVVVADAGRDRAAPGADEILALSDGRFGFRVADPLTSKRRGAFGYDEVRATREAEERAERLRLYYVAMTRAVDRLIVSGAIAPGSAADASTPIGWVLGRLGVEEELAGAAGPVELERGLARLLLRVDRPSGAEAGEDLQLETQADGQLALFGELPPPLAPLVSAPRLAPLEEPPAAPPHRPRKLSFTALATFERCSYRYYAERVAGMRPRDETGGIAGIEGLGATEVGSAVHAILEGRAEEEVLAGFPGATDENVERIRAFVANWHASGLPARVADAEAERHFTFEHDGVLLHGYLDLLRFDGGRALVVDYKTNTLAEGTPEEIVEADYRLQRLVYALACFRAGADEVEVAYAFLERPDAVVARVFGRADIPELEAELSAAIGRIAAGEFRPTPSEFTCAGCPALDVVCAGPRLSR